MVDTKISALPAATTPLTGTEVLPIVQGGTTDKVSIANLTAGRAISATQLTLTTGSLIVADGQGVDFSATPGTGTSKLFNDYKVGTWTPTNSGMTVTSGTFAATGTYTKIGNIVYFNMLQTSGTVSQNATQGMVSGLPFTPAAQSGCTLTNGSASISGAALVETNSVVYTALTFVNQTNLRLTGFYLV